MQEIKTDFCCSMDWLQYSGPVHINGNFKKSCKIPAVKKAVLAIIVLLILIILVLGANFYRSRWGGRIPMLIKFLRNPDQYTDWVIPAKTRCPGAPFVYPTDGYLGFLWQDSFKFLVAHQGLDIFSGKEAGVTDVFAAYDGFLTRQNGWKSSLIIRLPEDPLQPDRQIWLYMTHLADAQGNSLIDAKFPEGSVEVPVRQGELLGKMGNYSGNPTSPTGVHLHFSIVRDDGEGHYLNELKVRNTLDPSPYFGMQLDARKAGRAIPACEP